MAGVNKVILLGRLGQDPEVKYTPAGNTVCNMTLATSESYKDKQGNKKEKTEWHRLVCWMKLAEICEQYLKKGSQIYIEGSLQTRSWEDKNGQKRYTTEINVKKMEMVGDKQQQNNNGGGGFDHDSPENQALDKNNNFSSDNIPF